MKTSRRQPADEEMASALHRINSEFGAWRPSPSAMMSSGDREDDVCSGSAAPSPSPAPSPSQATATTRPCITFNPRVHGSSRHSKIDKFIEGLDAACEALPTPLVGSASGPPQPSRAPTSNDCSSALQDRHNHHHRHHHRHYHHRKAHQEDRPHHPSTGVVKEVKFADEVIEIGRSEALMSSERNCALQEHHHRESAAAREVAAESGARVSRAVRFDYRKRRSEFVKAATVVQSTYRGYKVRRGQPLKYLLAVSSVKERLEELRQQFDAWKIAAWFPTDLAERATMTESVMDLLVQLDSLQVQFHSLLKGKFRENPQLFKRNIEISSC